MDLAALGGLIGGVGQAAGGIASLFRQDTSSRDQWEMFNQNVQNQDRYWMQNANLQREFAQNAIRWRVEDAKAAGVHPIFAMGGAGASASPTAYVPGDIQPSGGGKDVGAALANMGQGVGRAFAANATKDRRMADVLEVLAVDQAQANLELTRAQTASVIARSTGAQIGPGMPSSGNMIPGQGNSPSLPGEKVEPNEVTARSPDMTSAAGVQPSIQWTRSSDGLVSEPGKASKAEDEFMAPLMSEWLVRNRVAPFLGIGTPPPMEIVRREFPGATGVFFDRSTMKWKPLYRGEKDFITRYQEWRSRQ